METDDEALRGELKQVYHDLVGEYHIMNSDTLTSQPYGASQQGTSGGFDKKNGLSL